MELKIESREQLEFVLRTAINQYDDCTIELRSRGKNSLFLIISSLPDNKILMSVCINGKSIGNIIAKDDREAKQSWLYKNCLSIITDTIVNTIYITLKEEPKIKNEIDLDGYYNVDYKDDYLTKHNRMRITQEPIKINTEYYMEPLCDIFELFIDSGDCDKLIISFSKYIEYLSHTFMIDLVIDKLYAYGKTLITFTGTRPDMESHLKSAYDMIVEYCDSDTSFDMNYLYDCFEQAIFTYYDMCEKVADGDVNINVYSNCKLN